LIGKSGSARAFFVKRDYNDATRITRNRADDGADRSIRRSRLIAPAREKNFGDGRSGWPVRSWMTGSVRIHRISRIGGTGRSEVSSLCLFQLLDALFCRPSA
jgi:hypothetical protein